MFVVYFLAEGAVDDVLGVCCHPPTGGAFVGYVDRGSNGDEREDRFVLCSVLIVEAYDREDVRTLGDQEGDVERDVFLSGPDAQEILGDPRLVGNMRNYEVRNRKRVQVLGHRNGKGPVFYVGELPAANAEGDFLKIAGFNVFEVKKFVVDDRERDERDVVDFELEVPDDADHVKVAELEDQTQFICELEAGVVNNRSKAYPRVRVLHRRREVAFFFVLQERLDFGGHGFLGENGGAFFKKDAFGGEKTHFEGAVVAGDRIC